VANEKSNYFDTKPQKSEPVTESKIEKAVLDPKTDTKFDFPMLKTLIDPGLNKPFPK
jgi:hypothetical protein